MVQIGGRLEWTMFSTSPVNAACCGTLQTRWWTLEVRDAVRLKNKSSRALVALGSPEAADGQQQAGCEADLEATEVKIGSVGEVGQDFWKTIRLLRREKCYPSNIV